MRLLAISGSLRRASINTAALESLAALAAPDFAVDIYRGLAALPAFNPDDDEEGRAPPESVRVWREAVAAADGLVIAAPEYAHGVPGALKNALDWLVASDAVPNKPVMLVNCAPRAFHAQSALRETLATMAARLVSEAFVTLAPGGAPISPETIAGDPVMSDRLRRSLANFRSAIRDFP